MSTGAVADPQKSGRRAGGISHQTPPSVGNAELEFPAAELRCFLLVTGATGKSHSTIPAQASWGAPSGRAQIGLSAPTQHKQEPLTRHQQKDKTQVTFSMYHPDVLESLAIQTPSPSVIESFLLLCVETLLELFPADDKRELYSHGTLEKYKYEDKQGKKMYL